MDNKPHQPLEWYTQPNRLATVGALAFIYAYWDKIPEKTTVLLMFTGFFLVPMLAVEVAFHFYFRKPGRRTAGR